MSAAKHATVILSAFLLAPSQAHAAPLRLNLDWTEMRAVVRHADLSPKITVRTGADGKGRVKGRLVGVEEDGVVLKKSGKRISVRRDNVCMIRLMPAKGHKYRWRTVAGIAALPIGLGSYVLGFWPYGGTPEGHPLDKTAVAVGHAIAIPVAVYQLARRADRGRGAIFITLNKPGETEKAQ